MLGGRGMGGRADAGTSLPDVRLPMRCMRSDTCEGAYVLEAASYQHVWTLANHRLQIGS
jgi:hypothetical protein